MWFLIFSEIWILMILKNNPNSNFLKITISSAKNIFLEKYNQIQILNFSNQLKLQ